MGRSGIDSGRMSGLARKLVVALAVLALLGLPIGYVVASDSFSDVPASSPYHNSINAIVNAGITAGCGSGKYCPKNAVTREQMAVFLSRLGNLAGQNPVVDALTVLGQLYFADEEDFTLVGGAPFECVTSENVVPIIPDEAFSYSVVHQLRDAPVSTDLINVQIEDPDLTDAEYDVCFRLLADTGNLTAGTYKTFYSAGITIGSGIFASTGATARSADFFQAGK